VHTTTFVQPAVPPLIAPKHLPGPPRLPSDQPPSEEIVGIGAVLAQKGPDADNGWVEIRGVLPDSPAALAGLSPPLIIHKVDNVSVEGMRLAECVQLVRGPIGSRIRLELSKPTEEGRFTVELTRDRVKVSSR
jgi:C-terminal processing protease CtpA/Prc